MYASSMLNNYWLDQLQISSHAPIHISFFSNQRSHDHVVRLICSAWLKRLKKKGSTSWSQISLRDMLNHKDHNHPYCPKCDPNIDQPLHRALRPQWPWLDKHYNYIHIHKYTAYNDIFNNNPFQFQFTSILDFCNLTLPRSNKQFKCFLPALPFGRPQCQHHMPCLTSWTAGSYPTPYGKIA